MKQPDPQPNNSRISKPNDNTNSRLSKPKENNNAASGIRGTGGHYRDNLNVPSNPYIKDRSNDPSVEYSDTKPIITNIYGV